MPLSFRRRALLFTTAAAVTLTYVLPVTAQEAQQSDNGEPILLDTITLFADRLGRALTDVQGHISVVDEEELKARNVQNLEDLLRYLPGVTAVRQVSAADPFGGQQGIRIRGVEGNRVQMVIDGGRIPERIIDGSRDYLDFNFTKQVDVVRGPASVLWGADALGGVLSLATIDPEDLLMGRDRGGEFSLGYGEVTDSTDVSAAFAMRFGQDVSVLLGRSRSIDHEAKLTNADPTGGRWPCARPVAYGSVSCGEFNPLDRTSDRTLAKLVWDIDDNQKLKFTYDRLDRESDVDVKTGLSSTTYASNRERDIWRKHYGAEYDANIGGVIDDVSAKLGWTPSGYRQHAQTSAINSSSQTVYTHDYIDYAEDFLELDIQATSRFSTGAMNHVLTFGIDGDYTETDYNRSRRTINATAGTDVTSVPQSWNFADGSTRRLDFFIQDQITMFGGKLELTPGLRYATYRMNPELNDSVTAIGDYSLDAREKEQLLASLGATWRFNDTYSVWAHYGEGFKMPTFQQLFTSSEGSFYDLVPAPWLVPEEVKSIEVGVRGEYDAGFWAVNVFQARYKNFIESFWEVPGTSNYSYRNLSSVKVWGLELETGWNVSDNVRLTGSLSWMDGEEQAESGAAKTQHLVPPLTAVLGASYELPDYDLTLRGAVTIVDKMKATDEENFVPPGYAVVDLGASWVFAENAVLNLSLNNVFDKKYYEMGAASSALAATSATTNTVPPELFTGAGRNVALSIDYKF